MNITAETAITRWVQTLKADPLCAILSGFRPWHRPDLPDPNGQEGLHGGLPGVGTFYEFIDRLTQTDFLIRQRKREKQQRKPHKFRKRPTKKPGVSKGGKAPELRENRHPGTVARLVRRIFNRLGQNLPPRPEDTLNCILKEVFVEPSLAKGLLGSHEDGLDVAMDGTAIRTGASRYGKKVCSCHKQGIYRCTCPRVYSDEEADWGWDSYREEYYFGHSLFVFAAAGTSHNLALYLRMASSRRHDSVISTYALWELRSLYADLRFRYLLGDSAFDAYALYQLALALGFKPIIDLNKTNSGNRQYAGPLQINEHGIPICPAAREMVYNGFCPDRYRIKWRCPAICGPDKKGKPCDCTCSTKPYGRVIYTKPADDPRLFTAIPRGTQEWKDTFAKRTSVERVNDALKNDYHAAHSRTRGRRRIFFRLALAAMRGHLEAWHKENPVNISQIIDSWTAPAQLAA